MPFWKEQKAQYAILDPLHRAVCCLPGVWVKHGVIKISTLVQVSDNPALYWFSGGEQWGSNKESEDKYEWIQGFGTIG